MVLGLIAAYYLGKSKGVKVTVEPEETQPTGTSITQDWSAFDQDPRSFEEIVGSARLRLKKE